MATTKLEPVLRPDGRWQCGFVTTCNRAVLQLNRNGADGGAAFLEASAGGAKFAPITPPILAPDITVPVNLPKGFTVRVISLIPIEYAAVFSDKAITPIPDPDQTYFPNAVQDIDGNWYDAVIIAGTVWTAENLRTKHYPSGDAIILGGYDPFHETGRMVYPNGDLSNFKKHGMLYDWFALMGEEKVSGANGENIRGISPAGWHIPSDAERSEFSMFAKRNGMFADSFASKEGWKTSSVVNAPGYSLESNNVTGFNAMPSGVGDGAVTGEGTPTFQRYTEETYFATTQINNNRLYSNAFGIQYDNKTPFPIWGLNTSTGRSVRCICDMTPSEFRQWYVNEYNTNNHQVNNKYATD